MTELLKNYLGGQWIAGGGKGLPLADPVTGQELVRVSNEGLDLVAGFDFARTHAGPALRQMTYSERAEKLTRTAEILTQNRDRYYEIALANSGTVKNDSAIDIDGAIYTVDRYAKWGRQLHAHALLDGQAEPLARDNAFVSQHVFTPTPGLALFINAFNFPSWGLWEKAAPALLSGVPIVVKPATTTAWLTQRMVADVVNAGIWPEGALSVVCGSSAGLLDALQAFDVLSFTGSAETAAIIRSHPAVTERSVRVNIEADSLNSALLLPDGQPGTPSFDLLVREVVREMTQKSGQKCTAIRRVFVPEHALDATLEQLQDKLVKVVTGNPRNENVRMGSLVNRTQYESVLDGIQQLANNAELVLDGRQAPLVDVDPAVSACLAPSLLALRDTEQAAQTSQVHHREVFGPVATVIPYKSLDQARDMIAAGGGSLVASLYSDDAAETCRTAMQLADLHGRIHVISPAVAKVQTGHGNVMPQSLHGGPGRAGGGQELGGLRALAFYHRRSVLQAAPEIIAQMDAIAAPF